MAPIDNQAPADYLVTSGIPERPDECKARDAYLRHCPCREVLDLLANRWTALLVSALVDRPMRFGQLARKLQGISKKVLSQTLRSLERDGLVTRTVRPAPLEVYYELTSLGRSVAEPLQAVRQWSEVNYDRIVLARAVYDTRVERSGPWTT